MSESFEGRLTAKENAARDLVLLTAGECAVRVAVLSDRSVSLGVGQRGETRAERTANVEGVPILRRSSGGTGLLHDPGDIAWTIVLPRTHHLAGPRFVRSYGRLGQGVVAFLSERGVEGKWAAPIGLSDEFCLFGPRGEVLEVGGRILGGAAQHLTSKALLHHGILHRRVDAASLERFFGIPSALSERHLIGLQPLGIDPASETVGRSLVRCLHDSLQAELAQ